MRQRGKLVGMAKWAILAVVLCLLLLSWMFKWFSAEEHKATWLWDASIIAEQTPEIIAFSKEQGVDTIFLQIQDELPDATYRKFIATADRLRLKCMDLTVMQTGPMRRSGMKDLLLSSE